MLLRLEGEIEEFSLIFSGKTSKKVHGLYHPETREIIIHNKNFNSDNALMYTAIHEFAHHIHFTRSPVPISSRSHTTGFRNIFHKLLLKAEQEGIYTNMFEQIPEFVFLTKRIKDNYLTANAKEMMEFGRLLMEARELCRKHNARFEDYVERILTLDTRSAKTLIKISDLDIKPEIGFENMKTVARIADPDDRKAAEEAFAKGESPDMVKERYSPKRREEDPKKQLLAEKRRIERTISSLSKRLEEVESRLQHM